MQKKDRPARVRLALDTVRLWAGYEGVGSSGLGAVTNSDFENCVGDLREETPGLASLPSE